MTFSVIAHVSHLADGSTSTAIDTTGANLLIYGVSYLNGDAANAPPIDSKGNTWTQIGSPVGNSARDFATFYYVASPTAGTGHTFHSTSTAIGSFTVLAVSGATTTPFDQFNGTSYLGDNTTTTRQTGSVTPTQAGELFVAFMSVDDPSGSTFSIDTGFSIVETIDVVTGSSFGAVLAYKVQTGAAAAENPTFTRSIAGSTSRYDNAIIGSFKSSIPSISAAMPAVETADVFAGDLDPGIVTGSVSLLHNFHSAQADDPDATLVRPSNWNEQHAFTGTAGSVVIFDASGNVGSIGPGSTAQVLHGGTPPVFNAVSLATDVTGNLSTNNLASGTGATGTTFWCGDGTWKTPPGGTGTGVPGGSPNSLQYNNAGIFGGIGLGTTTTVLHGSATGIATFAAVNLTTDVTGTLPATNGGFVDAPTTNTMYGRIGTSGSMAWGRAVAVTGDTMTGGLTVAPSASAPFVQLTAPSAQPAQMTLAKGSSGQYSGIYGDTGTSARWLIQLGDAAAESGGASGSTGSNFSIQRYNNSGAVIDTPLSIARATGIVSFAQAPAITGFGQSRIPLAANTTFFVSPTGSDTTGDGSSGNPWQTPQHAYAVIQATYDFRGNTVAISLNGQTFTTGFNINSGWIGGGTLLLTNGTISVTAASTSAIFVNSTPLTGLIQVSNMTVGATGSGGYGIANLISGTVQLLNGVVFNPCAIAHLLASAPGAQIVGSSQTFVINSSGATQVFVNASAVGSQINLQSATITMNGTYSFTGGLANASNQSAITLVGAIFGGTPTFTGASLRYSVSSLALINTNTGNVNFIPGNTAGTATSSGLYL